MQTTLVQVGQDHVIGDVIHVQIFRDTSESDPQRAFSAKINAPGNFSDTLQISNSASQDFKIPVSVSGIPNPTLHVEVDDFTLLPAGASPAQATALRFLLVFKIVEIFRITIGSVPVTAALR